MILTPALPATSRSAVPTSKRALRRLLRTRTLPPDSSITLYNSESSESHASTLIAPELLPKRLNKYACRWDTPDPTSEQLKQADEFFLRYPPKHLWSRAKFKEIDFGNVPEVAFLGRSNVGKSSLLNSLLNNLNMAYTSSKPGRTRLMNAFAVNHEKLLLLDMPGYGHASREDWGTQVMKYLTSRKQLRRAYVLIDAKHGPKASDMMLLEYLGQANTPHQIVLSKVDRLNPRDDSLERAFGDIKYLIETGSRGISALGEILGTAATPARSVPRIGLSELRWSILAACGLDGLAFRE